MSSGQVELGVPVEHGEQFPVQVEIHGRVAGRTLVAGMIQFVKYVELNIRRVIIFCRVFQPFFRGIKIVTSVLVVGGDSPGGFIRVLVQIDRTMRALAFYPGGRNVCPYF